MMRFAAALALALAGCGGPADEPVARMKAYYVLAHQAQTSCLGRLEAITRARNANDGAAAERAGGEMAQGCAAWADKLAAFGEVPGSGRDPAVPADNCRSMLLELARFGERYASEPLAAQPTAVRTAGPGGRNMPEYVRVAIEARDSCQRDLSARVNSLGVSGAELMAWETEAVRPADDPSPVAPMSSPATSPVPAASAFVGPPTDITGTGVFAVVLSHMAEAAAVERAARRTCLRRGQCQVLGWFDEDFVPSAMPLTRREALRQAFAYTLDRATGEDDAVWTCANWPTGRAGCPNP